MHRINRIEIFDEWEEWHLVLAHYAIRCFKLVAAVFACVPGVA